MILIEINFTGTKFLCIFIASSVIHYYFQLLLIRWCDISHLIYVTAIFLIDILWTKVFLIISHVSLVNIFHLNQLAVVSTIPPLHMLLERLCLFWFLYATVWLFMLLCYRGSVPCEQSNFFLVMRLFLKHLLFHFWHTYTFLFIYIYIPSSINVAYG